MGRRIQRLLFRKRHVYRIVSLKSTIGNEQWMRENESALKKLLPDTWTHMDNLSGQPILKTAFGFKLLGIDWRSAQEFEKVMVYLEKLGILQRQNGYQVRANPGSIFQ